MKRSIYRKYGNPMTHDEFLHCLTEKQEKRYWKKWFNWDFTSGKGFWFFYFNKKTKKFRSSYITL